MTEIPQPTNTPDNWDQHWDDFGDPAQGNPANLYRQGLIFRLLGNPPPGAKILDIGSGQGEMALLLRGRYPTADIWGIEYSMEGVHRATKAAERAQLDIRFSQRDLLLPQDVPAADRNWATHAVCSEVLEHVDRPEVLIGNARGYLAPGCRLVVTVPGGPRSAFDRHIGHRQHFTPTTLRSVLEKGGFLVHTVQRAGFPFFNLYRLSVIARGRRLIDDLSRTDESAGSSKAMGLALQGFEQAFRLNLPSSPFGWQMLAVATPA
jgi:SAM-dependent methyltransferase